MENVLKDFVDASARSLFLETLLDFIKGIIRLLVMRWNRWHLTKVYFLNLMSQIK